MMIAFLMLFRNMDFESAFDSVREKSSVIDPNAGFLIQLS